MMKLQPTDGLEQWRMFRNVHINIIWIQLSEIPGHSKSNDKYFSMKIFEISLKNLSMELEESYRKKTCWIFSLFLKNTCDFGAD